MRKPFAQIIFAVSLAAGAALVTPSLAADAPQKVSPAVGKPLSQAAAAMKTNDFATALTHVKEAQAASTHAPFDDYTINQFLGNIYIGQKDFKSAESAFEAMATSPALPPADKSARLIPTSAEILSSVFTVAVIFPFSFPVTSRFRCIACRTCVTGARSPSESSIV